MMGLPIIFLVRHGQTQWNKEGRYQGQKDSPLTPKGEYQAKENALKLAKYINNFNQVKIFSSPLGRAKSTALIMCSELGIGSEKITFDNRLKEFDYGIFEGELKSYCETIYAKEFQEREANKWNYQIENGESYEMVTQRLSVWLDEIRDEKFVILIAHEMINRALRGLYLNLEHEKTLKLRQPNDLILLLKEGRELILG